MFSRFDRPASSCSSTDHTRQGGRPANTDCTTKSRCRQALDSTRSHVRRDRDDSTQSGHKGKTIGPLATGGAGSKEDGSLSPTCSDELQGLGSLALPMPSMVVPYHAAWLLRREPPRPDPENAERGAQGLPRLPPGGPHGLRPCKRRMWVTQYFTHASGLSPPRCASGRQHFAQNSRNTSPLEFTEGCNFNHRSRSALILHHLQ